jgi:hypothetical protein
MVHGLATDGFFSKIYELDYGSIVSNAVLSVSCLAVY